MTKKPSPRSVWAIASRRSSLSSTRRIAFPIDLGKTPSTRWLECSPQGLTIKVKCQTNSTKLMPKDKDGRWLPAGYGHSPYYQRDIYRYAVRTRPVREAHFPQGRGSAPKPKWVSE